MQIRISAGLLGIVLVAGCMTMPESSLQANSSNRDELVCRRERTTGSNLPRRVCRLKSDIERRAALDQRELEDVQRQVRYGELPGDPH